MEGLIEFFEFVDDQFRLVEGEIEPIFGGLGKEAVEGSWVGQLFVAFDAIEVLHKCRVVFDVGVGVGPV